jgi:hypothetical protein
LFQIAENYIDAKYMVKKLKKRQNVAKQVYFLSKDFSLLKRQQA